MPEEAPVTRVTFFGKVAFGVHQLFSFESPMVHCASLESANAMTYRNLAEEMKLLAQSEPDEKRRAELFGLADQYHKLAERAVDRRSKP